MTLAELITVMAIGSVVLAMVTMVTVSMVRHDRANIVRQSRVDGVRQVSVWLGDALTYAAPPPAARPEDPLEPAFEAAGADRMVFTSALPIPGHTEGRIVSRLTVVLGKSCWDLTEDTPGVLHRCRQTPQVDPAGKPTFCARGAPGCSDDLFEDLVVARGVKDGPLFSYFVRDGENAVQPAGHSVAAADLGRLAAVEILITVGAEPDKPGSDVSAEATVFKRFTVADWRLL
ncbi:MAG: hypothetical protein LBJ02_05240 [Bifidobacteriaceae bacterium]|jgi:hypothetical protein|nr:hypothetical protein [Bifidobacteriaceae bacterium]